MVEAFTDPLALLALTVSLGLAAGRIRIGRFSLGSSGTLFAGLLLGWLVVSTASDPDKADYLSRGVIHSDMFYLALALFIASVALSSARNLGKIIKVYGVRLLGLGALVPVIGAASAWGLSRIIPGITPGSVPGVFTGALTSSPGLAAALEQVAGKSAEAEASVGFGYAVGYIPGVLIVVLAMQLIPVIFKLDTNTENQAFCKDLNISPETEPVEDGRFHLLEFFLVITLGHLLGTLKIPLGALGQAGLGSTGGILAAGLLLGFKGKLGPLDFRMSPSAMAVIRELGIVLFLSVVGLRYGYRTIVSMAGGGLPLLTLSLGIALISISLGFLFGRYVLKLNWILLAGALCGAMTSTPGLGAAVETTGCDDVASGYGAVYPVSLLSMVLLTIMLSIFT